MRLMLGMPMSVRRLYAQHVDHWAQGWRGYYWQKAFQWASTTLWSRNSKFQTLIRCFSTIFGVLRPLCVLSEVVLALNGLTWLLFRYKLLNLFVAKKSYWLKKFWSLIKSIQTTGLPSELHILQLVQRFCSDVLNNVIRKIKTSHKKNQVTSIRV